jgi:hypothetical protein
MGSDAAIMNNTPHLPTAGSIGQHSNRAGGTNHGCAPVDNSALSARNCYKQLPSNAWPIQGGI